MVEWIVIVEFKYNNSNHSLTGKTLFYLAYDFHYFISNPPQFTSEINIFLAQEKVLRLTRSRLYLE